MSEAKKIPLKKVEWRTLPCFPDYQIGSNGVVRVVIQAIGGPADYVVIADKHTTYVKMIANNGKEYNMPVQGAIQYLFHK